MLAMHWTRVAVIAGGGLALVGTCMPWLVNVPPEVLTIGSGTIHGITTVHGIIGAVLAAAVIAVAIFVPPRRERLHRGLLGGMIAAAVIAVSIGSLVIGTSPLELLEEAERQTLERTGDQHQANLAFIAMAELLDQHPIDAGWGGYPFMLGWAVIALVAIIGMFLRKVTSPTG